MYNELYVKNTKRRNAMLDISYYEKQMRLLHSIHVTKSL